MHPLNNPKVAIAFTYAFAAVAFVVAFLASGLPALPSPWLGGSLLPTSLQLDDPKVAGFITAFIILPCWVIHYLRRTLEVIFVADYKRARPVIESIGAPIHYGLFAIWMGWAIRFEGDYAPPVLSFVAVGLGLFAVGEVGNMIAHIMLRDLRAKGQEAPPPHHLIPRGFLFEYVSFPHYFFEILTWLGFFLMTMTMPAAAFLLATLITLFSRAGSAHRRYHEEFDGKDGRELYPASRKALIPFVF